MEGTWGKDNVKGNRRKSNRGQRRENMRIDDTFVTSELLHIQFIVYLIYYVAP